MAEDSRPEVLVLSAPLPPQLAKLDAAYRLHRGDLDRESAVKAARNVRAIASSGFASLDRATIEALPKLEVVACWTAGYDTVDMAALNERGIKLTNTSDVLADDVADTAVMLMLAARRGLVRGDAWVRTGDWGRHGAMPLMQATVGKRVGIAGLGTLGRAIADRCKVMKLDVAYHGRGEKPDSGLRYFANLVEMARWADILIASMAGGAATRGIISAEVIEALGPEGCFVNVARGTVVDEPALIAALRDGRLGTAGLDVFLNEPNPDPAFRTLRNVVLYPHHASATVETRNAMSESVVQNLAAFFAGQPLLTPVN